MGESDSLVISMCQMIEDLDKEAESDKPCTIFKVPEAIRRQDPTSYTPNIISIGPFHHGDPALEPMEQLKCQFLRDLISRDRRENSVQKYIQKAKDLEREARNCYSHLDYEMKRKKINMDSNAFVKMLVLDGCFIIEFLLKFLDNNERQLYQVIWNLPLLRNDLLLLENQMPFFVLQSLFDSTTIPDDVEEDCPVTLEDLVVGYLRTKDYRSRRFLTLPQDVHHLLHTFHSSILPSQVMDETCSISCWETVKTRVNKIINILLHPIFWILSLLLIGLMRLTCLRPRKPEQNQNMPTMTPTATELAEAGIKFKIKKNSTCFLDITFNVLNGTMEIPLLSIEKGTISEFRNLIAFEQCCPASGSHFTSYVALLDNLIDTPQDVALLERCGVIESKLGDNVELAGFFNSLVKGLYLDYEDHHLVGLFNDVKKYCAKPTHRWRAKMVHDYFSNPWSFISLLAAIVLLVLTSLQTYYTIYAYKHPPHN